jgi:hypothetical protein
MRQRRKKLFGSRNNEAGGEESRDYLFSTRGLVNERLELTDRGGSTVVNLLIILY